MLWSKGFTGGDGGKDPVCQSRRCRRYGFNPLGQTNFVYVAQWLRAQTLELDKFYLNFGSVVVQSLSCVWFFVTPWAVGFPVLHYLLELAQTHVHWVSDAIQPSHPLLSPSPPTFNLSQYQDLFQWVGSSHQVAKYGSFSLNISSSNEYSGLISLRTDWLDLLAVAVQGTLKSLIQHHSSKTSILWHLAFFIVQLSHPYTTTGKTIALTRRTSLCSPSNVSALEYAV